MSVPIHSFSWRGCVGNSVVVILVNIHEKWELRSLRLSFLGPAGTGIIGSAERPIPAVKGRDGTDKGPGKPLLGAVRVLQENRYFGI